MPYVVGQHIIIKYNVIPLVINKPPIDVVNGQKILIASSHHTHNIKSKQFFDFIFREYFIRNIHSAVHTYLITKTNKKKLTLNINITNQDYINNIKICFFTNNILKLNIYLLKCFRQFFSPFFFCLAKKSGHHPISPSQQYTIHCLFIDSFYLIGYK